MLNANGVHLQRNLLSFGLDLQNLIIQICLLFLDMA